MGPVTHRSRARQLAAAGVLIAGGVARRGRAGSALLAGGAALTGEVHLAAARRARRWSQAGDVRVLSTGERRGLRAAAATGLAAAAAATSRRPRGAVVASVASWAITVAFLEWLQGLVARSRQMLRLLPRPAHSHQEVVVVHGEADIVDAVRRARDDGRRVRALGSRNSSPEYRPDQSDNRYLLLDLTSYNEVIALDASRRRIHVQAGMTQGALVAAIDAVGLALPALNGSHQLTVGGTLATGSICGARYLLNDHIVALTVVDAAGERVTLDRDRDRAVFGAYVCSLGLLGVLSSVEYELEPAFNVVGDVRRIDFADLLGLGEAEQVTRFDYLVNDWYPLTGEVISRQLHRMPPGAPLGGERQGLDGMTPFVSGVGQLLTQTANVSPRLLGLVARLFTMLFRDRAVRAPWYDLIVVDTDFDLAYHPIDYLEVVVARPEYRPFMEDLAAIYEREPDIRPLVPVITDWVAPDDLTWIGKNSVADRHGSEMFAVVTVAHQRVDQRAAADVFAPAIALGQEVGARMHWGKHPWMRDGSDIAGSLPDGNFERFCELRQVRDPDGIFLTDLFEQIFVTSRG